LRIALPLVLAAWLLGDLGAGTGPVPLRAVDALVVLLVVAVLLVVRRRGGARLDVAAGGYLLLALVAELQFTAGRAELTHVLAVLTPGLLLLALPQLLDPDERQGTRAVAWAGVILAGWTLLDAVGALAQHAGGPAAYYAVKLELGTPLADHNVLAALLVVALAAAAVRAADDPRWLAGLGLLSLALGATLSRGAVLAAVAVGLIGLAFLRPRRAAVRFVGGAIVASVLVFGAALVLGAEVPDEDGPTSVVSRTQLWGAGLEAIAEEPLVGVGPAWFREFAADAGVHDPRDHSHSVLLQGAATMGIPAGLVHLALWVLLLWRGAAHPDRHVRTIVMLGAGALMAHALIDETALRGSVEVLVAVLLALTSTGGLGVRDVGRTEASRARG
jgi:O-antigen ligase